MLVYLSLSIVFGTKFDGLNKKHTIFSLGHLPVQSKGLTSGNSQQFIRRFNPRVAQLPWFSQ